jgi:predicted Zn finger-like uncharacterized protein
MATQFDCSCPHCGKRYRVPEELSGKTIRCKNCQKTFQVPQLSATNENRAATAASGPKAKKTALADDSAPIPFKEDPPAPPVTSVKRTTNDEDDANPYGVIRDDSDIPRCPFCAKELDPPDTKICLNCGYDLIARRRHESKKVYEATAVDWISHLGPAIACVILIIALIGLDIYVFLNLSEWMTGGILDAQEKNKITGEPEFYIKPFCFNIWIGVFTAWICWMAGKFAFIRLVYNWKPPERLKK